MSHIAHKPQLQHGGIARMSAALSFVAIAFSTACADSPTTAPERFSARMAAGGNSANAKACQKGGWQTLVTSSGGSFANQDECVSYGAKGGTLLRMQTIAFAELSGKTVGDPDFVVSATASSLLQVSFGAAGSCTVSGTTVHLTGVGNCTITASQSGDDTWGAAPNVARSFNIAKRNQTVAFTSENPTPVVVGGTYTPTASATSGLAATITLAATSTGCTLSAGVVSFTATGSCVVYANQSGNESYNAASQVQQSITVVAAVSCVADEETLRTAASLGGTYEFCEQGATVYLTGGEVSVSRTFRLKATGRGNADIEGDFVHRIFNVSGAKLTLDNVSLSNGRSPDALPMGGAIYISGQSELTLNGDSHIFNNEASKGAGVYAADNSPITITMNDFASIDRNVTRRIANTPTGGGGVYAGTQTTVIMNGLSSIHNNFLGDIGDGGGGILMNGATLRMNNRSSIVGNSAGSAQLGGGVNFKNAGLLVLSDSADIRENTAGDGGGIYRADNGLGTITGVTQRNVHLNSPNNCAGTTVVTGCVNN